MSSTTRPPALVALALAAGLLLASCNLAKKAALKLVYEPAGAPAEVLEDVAYYEGEGFDPQKHRLDLFVPSTAPAAGSSGWPALVFVHGGSFEKGDKDFEFAGADIYGNIGRFYADHGYVTAVISYRLQPQVGWPEQVLDVARATAWVARHAREHGSDGRVVLSGHSAGAYLSARIAFDPEVRAAAGMVRNVAGVVAVSGAGYDLTDEGFWRAGAEIDWWASHFDDGQPDWQTRASVAPLVAPGGPPFLIMFSTGEWASLGYDNIQFDRDLELAGVPVTLKQLKGLRHSLTVVRLSQPDSPIARAVLDFLDRVAKSSTEDP